MTHISVQCIFNSLQWDLCTSQCVCVRVLGWSRGGALQESSHLPLSESRSCKLWERTEETREIVFSCDAELPEKRFKTEARQLLTVSGMATGRNDPPADRHV